MGLLTAGGGLGARQGAGIVPRRRLACGLLLSPRVTAREVAPAGQSGRKGSGRGARGKGAEMQGFLRPRPSDGHAPPRPPDLLTREVGNVQGSPPVDAPGVQSLMTEEGLRLSWSPGLFVQLQKS